MKTNKKSVVYLILLICLVLLIVCFAAYKISNKDKESNSGKDDVISSEQDRQKESAKSVDDMMSYGMGQTGLEARKLALKGDVQGGIDLMVKKAESEKDQKATARGYLSAALLAYNNDAYKESYILADKAYTMNPDLATAQLAGDAAYKLKDKQNAIAYYEKAISYWNDERKKQEAEFYQDQLNKLEKAKAL